jgi:hypothetical protein
VSNKKFLKDPPEERLVKCYACEGKGCVPVLVPDPNSYYHHWDLQLAACKECYGFGNVVLKPIDQASTLFDEEATMVGMEAPCLSSR